MTRLQDIWAAINLRLQNPYLQKLMKDNIGVLATIIAWNALTSIVPILFGLVAISGVLLQGHLISQTTLIGHLSHALDGTLTTRDIETVVKTSRQHTGLFGVLSVAGMLWGGSNIGGAISTAFQPIFEVSGRNFFKEKLLDIGMIFVMAILMIIIVSATTFSALINRLTSNFPLSGAAPLVVGILIALVAAFTLFFAIYAAFPNTTPRLRFRHIWLGALVAAILFELLSLAWPIYVGLTHFSRYGAFLLSILLLTAWLYFFSLITILGAEVAAITALREANREHRSIGPQPQNYVPQHEVLREFPHHDRAAADR